MFIVKTSAGTFTGDTLTPSHADGVGFWVRNSATHEGRFVAATELQYINFMDCDGHIIPDTTRVV